MSRGGRELLSPPAAKKASVLKGIRKAKKRKTQNTKQKQKTIYRIDTDRIGQVFPVRRPRMAEFFILPAVFGFCAIVTDGQDMGTHSSARYNSCVSRGKNKTKNETISLLVALTFLAC